MRLELAPLFSRALYLTWRHRVLWVYGFLLVLLGGECLRLGFETGLGSEDLEQVVAGIRRIDEGTRTSLAIAAVSILGVAWGLSVVVGNWALGSLLSGLQQAATGEVTSFRRASRGGQQHFWSLVFIGLSTGLVGLLVALPSLVSAVLGALYDQPLLIVGACLWLPVAMLVWAAIGLLATVAQIHAVLASAGPLSAFTSAWRFIVAHLGDLLLVWAASDVGVGCAAGCATAALLLAAGVPAWIGFMLNPAIGIALLVPSVLFMLVVVAGRGVVAVFQRAIWLLAYRELDSRR